MVAALLLWREEERVSEEQLQSASSRSTMRRSFAGFGSLVNRAFGGQKWADLDNFLFFYHSGP